MTGYYVYLISSLPMLHFGTKPPFSMEKFFSVCAELISAADLEALKSSLNGEGEGRYHDFETTLRNELVKIRAQRKHLDASRFLRGDGYADQWISHAAAGAYRNPSVIGAEKMLDLDRWRFLDELSMGHYFDIEILMIYARKLSILERWERVRTADADKLLEEALTA
ncbi:MAG: DUF2764 family protein [Candidatus Omnitrophica bacterium]|nr:DUF2764 family protein [Candidatus Omnitrophota bacterium]